MTVLDTQVWVWFPLGDRNIPGAWRDEVAARPDGFAISAISVWEMLVLAGKGRLRPKPDPVAFVRDALEASPFRVVPLTSEIVIASRVAFQHEDPADRFIAATAGSCRARLMTLDWRLRDFGWLDAVLP